MMTLLETSGYVQSPDVITEELLERVLVSHPEWIDSWVTWSCDKRTAAGWYLLTPKESSIDGSWVVGYYPDGDWYSSPEAARSCAIFIKREIEALRASSKTKHQ